MIISRIVEWARCQPTKTAFINNDQVYSYAAFARAIEAVRRFLEQQGLPAGQTAVVLSESPGSTWILVLALRWLGLNTIAVASLAQAEALNLGNVIAFVASQEGRHKLELTRKPQTGAKTIIVPNAIFLQIWSGDLPVDHYGAPPFGGHILLTSGTTGTYKKLLLPGKYENSRNEARAQAYQLTKHTIYHGSYFGLWTTIGFRMAAAIWHVGGCAVFEDRPKPFNRFFRHGVDFSILTSPMLKHLVQSMGAYPSQDNCELSIAAGFLPAALAEEAMRLVTKKIGIGFGSSELSTPAMLSGSREFTYWLEPIADRTVQVVDENQRECPTGQEGELRILLKDMDCSSYLDDADATAKAFRDGFFYPGDMAVRREDARVRILGRTADVLNVQGVKVAAAPLELDLQRMLGVDEVCLFSGLNGKGKEQLVIAVQSDKELPKAAMETIVRKFSSFEQVRFAILPEFPRTATGTQKTQRSVLRNAVFPESAE
jgi:acyl-coenzyme A synthetase/AMP-(fatty) acid ligase